MMAVLLFLLLLWRAIPSAPSRLLRGNVLFKAFNSMKKRKKKSLLYHSFLRRKAIFFFFLLFLFLLFLILLSLLPFLFLLLHHHLLHHLLLLVFAEASQVRKLFSRSSSLEDLPRPLYCRPVRRTPSRFMFPVSAHSFSPSENASKSSSTASSPFFGATRV